MKKNKKKTFSDWISVIIALIGVLIFGSTVIGCYVWLFMNPSVANLIGALFISIIPGLITYGIIGALVDFLRGT